MRVVDGGGGRGGGDEEESITPSVVSTTPHPDKPKSVKKRLGYMTRQGMIIMQPPPQLQLGTIYS
jgi:hypothetical protein